MKNSEPGSSPSLKPTRGHMAIQRQEVDLPICKNGHVGVRISGLRRARAPVPEELGEIGCVHVAVTVEIGGAVRRIATRAPIAQE